MHWAIIKKFCHYHIGQEFQFLTGSNPLSKVMPSKRGAAEMNELVDLSSYNFSIIYRHGENDRNVDALSRYNVKSESDSDDGIIALYLYLLMKCSSTNLAVKSQHFLNKHHNKYNLTTYSNTSWLTYS